MMLTYQELERRFTYHAPDDAKRLSFQEIRMLARNLAKLIDGNCPDGREKALAFTALEESVMWANAGIAREGGVTAPLDPEFKDAEIRAAVEAALHDRLVHGYGRASGMTVREVYKAAAVAKLGPLPWTGIGQPGDEKFKAYVADVAATAAAIADALIEEDKASMGAFMDAKEER